MAKCALCEQEMTGKGVSCSPLPWAIFTEKSVKTPRAFMMVCLPVRHGEETRAPWGDDGKNCHDCNAPVGAFHHSGCDVEECPSCRNQAIGCDCGKDVDFEPPEMPEGVEQMRVWIDG